ncbi:MAG: hypothetical protein KFB97_07700 [Cyanobium sp. M30B3]|jgi:hypothetical protein|nr:MAG: hypothetical protein KFB97_07700 [Cyanobium sp. M30B3]
MVASPNPLAGSAQLLTLPDPLLLALVPLLERAPAGLFPRARRLYFDKYPLEGRPQDLDQAPAPGPFRTFVLRETLGQADTQEDSGLGGRPQGAKLHELALVHWQERKQAAPEQVLGYLRQRWQLEPANLEVMQESWFREGGAWVRLTLPGADPVPVEADPATTP